jgi:hypothetical protein
MSLGGVRRFAVRRDAKTLLQLRRAAEYNARSDDRILLKLDGQSLQERAAL